MSQASISNTKASFLGLPPELRNEIYAHLLCINLTRTQKPYPESCRTSSRYIWNLHTSILAVNSQIHGEAREVLGWKNEFVVIDCAAWKLEQTPKEIKHQHREVYDQTLGEPSGGVRLLPIQKCVEFDVPHERLRIRLATTSKPKVPKSWFYVVLVEELLDLCTGLSTFLPRYPGLWERTYRMVGLSLKVWLRPPPNQENQQDKDLRERRLLNPLAKLRLLKAVTIEGATPESTSEQLLRQDFDGPSVISTSYELMFAGDNAYKDGHFDAACGHYCRASVYTRHFTQRRVLTNSADCTVLEFHLNLKRARTWLELLRFADALAIMDSNLSFVNKEFLTHIPNAIDPNFEEQTVCTLLRPRPTLEVRESMTLSESRKRKCASFAGAAIRFGHRITCEDIGRCYAYKSILERCSGGDEASSRADADKLMSVECFTVSGAASESCIEELLDREYRIVEKAATPHTKLSPGV